MNAIREKILLLLLGGVAFGYSITPGKQRMEKNSKREPREGIKYLYRLDFIDKDDKSYPKNYHHHH